MNAVRAFAPASIGNLAAGFDTLGAALRPLDGSLLGDWVELREAAGFRFTWDGPFASQLPSDPVKNLALRACAAFEHIWGRPLPPLALHLHKGLPVGSGLGSSSATVVATLRALDLFLQRPLDETRLLRAAGEAEAMASGAVHLDNVAPALLGGVRFMDALGRARALAFPDALRFAVVLPELNLLTRDARAVLPEAVPLPLALDHARNLASLVHALHTDDQALLRATLRDLVAEPHRARLVPGFRAVQAAALDSGALGCTLSGAGPAVFAVAEAARAAPVGAAMARAWELHGVASRVLICEVDRQGARALEAP
ncbi:MAG TPA: homoserine kinase [Holophagaceae bacterium]|jgi:homoserine kinase|nr:homoserine kinase [Holophagaceae bacterium]